MLCFIKIFSISGYTTNLVNNNSEKRFVPEV